ncbi:hypothetical protein AVEN_269346-1 [Araneus ventricosus]|uniref:Uncharacterized protein n=1 Tax=Araneus ventricosus TaxID=182803 RepID=A0A4Y2M6W4_ARAVE|nr:hypothetical protein AVEN_269346-1 [Araneus ventricosus]
MNNYDSIIIVPVAGIKSLEEGHLPTAESSVHVTIARFQYDTCKKNRKITIKEQLMTVPQINTTKTAEQSARAIVTTTMILTECPDNCDNCNDPERVCILRCVHGCVCNEGFIRKINETGSDCKKPNACP